MSTEGSELAEIEFASRLLLIRSIAQFSITPDAVYWYIQEKQHICVVLLIFANIRFKLQLQMLQSLHNAQKHSHCNRQQYASGVTLTLMILSYMKCLFFRDLLFRVLY